MVKLRDARYCNLKLFLMFLVIYGHLIEPDIENSTVLKLQYQLIYFFHMPLFCFLSGLFLNNKQSCNRQWKKNILAYTSLQTVILLMSNRQVTLSTPFWHLWYLFSYSIWVVFGWMWFCFCKGKGKIIILVCSILIGCTVGLIPSVGREYSLSRTLVFFPYFWTDLIFDSKYAWQKLKPIGLVSIGIAIFIMLKVGHKIPISFLYHASPYGTLEHGILLRITCYLLGTLISIFLLAFTPMQRFPFTKSGANTMPAYLIHAPIALYIREWNIPWYIQLLISSLLLYVIYKIQQWHSELYGIVPSERREN